MKAASDSTGRELVLASSSPYRRELLARLRLSFSVEKPATDEAYLPAEVPIVRAHRLSFAKAQAVAERLPNAFVVGSDQVACIGAEIFDKPGTPENARRQLQRLRGEEVTFHTGVAVVCRARKAASVRVVPYFVRFRRFDDDEIDRYLSEEKPFDCAASAKAEGLGISLIAAMRGEDPTAIIGLPLITLSGLLRQHGFRIP